VEAAVAVTAAMIVDVGAAVVEVVNATSATCLTTTPGANSLH